MGPTCPNLGLSCWGFQLQRLSRLSASAQRSQGSQPPPGWRMLLGCPMSQPPRKPLFCKLVFVIVFFLGPRASRGFGHAVFVIVCLSCERCRAWRSARVCRQAHTHTLCRHVGSDSTRPDEIQTNKSTTVHTTRQLHSTVTRKHSSNQKKIRKRTAQDSCIPRSQDSTQRNASSLLFSPRTSSAVAVEMGSRDRGSTSGFLLAMRTELERLAMRTEFERKSHCIKRSRDSRVRTGDVASCHERRSCH